MLVLHIYRSSSRIFELDLFVLTGETRVANEATLWYVPLCVRDVKKVLPVPPITYSSPDQARRGEQAYQRVKSEQQVQVITDDMPQSVAGTYFKTLYPGS